jgi:hypothetical protein
VRCEFRLKDGLRTLAGRDFAGQRSFAFSTGGPAVAGSTPHEGWDRLQEDQIFVLELDGEATESSVLEHVTFTVDGIASPIAVRIVTGAEREAILKATYGNRRDRPAYLLLLQARQNFPPAKRVTLVWGRGVQSPSGVASESDQALPFVTRDPFTARFHCQRENPEAACVPVTPMAVDFSGSVPWSDAAKIVLRGPGGKVYQPDAYDYEKNLGYVTEVEFAGPFPERSAFTIELPRGLKDDSGRELTNADQFPLTVRTDEYPPLAKFAAPSAAAHAEKRRARPVRSCAGSGRRTGKRRSTA